MLQNILYATKNIAKYKFIDDMFQISIHDYKNIGNFLKNLLNLDKVIEFFPSGSFML